MPGGAPSTRDACALVLAGGLSKRFGSDKALALFRGAPLFAYVAAGLRARGFAQICVVAKEPERYALAGIEMVRDLTPLLTPLAGLHAGLVASRHERVFACAADMPFAASDAALLEALLKAAPAVASHGGQVQPLCSAWLRSLALPRIEALVQAGAGVRAFSEAMSAAIIEWPEGRPFLDADTPDALAGF